jgi:hypothetical protein
MRTAPAAAEADFLEARGLRVPAGLDLSGIAPTAWHGPAPELVEGDALRRDLPILRAALEQAYVGRELAAWDWDGFFASWSSELECGPLPAAAAFARWSGFTRAWPDRHTGPLLGQPTPRPHTALLDPVSGPIRAWRDTSGREHAGRTLQAHTARRPAGSVTVVRTIGELGPATAVEVDGVWRPVQALPPSGSPTFPTAARLADDVAYLRIGTPSAGTEPPARPPSARLLVCDLRGNRGGSVGPWLELFGAWFGDGVLEPLRAVGGLELESPITPALRWGCAQALLQGAEGPLAEPQRSQVQALLDALALPAPSRALRRRPGAWLLRDRPGAPGRGQPRPIVLVDDSTGSDGELLALLLAALPGAVLVGRGTAGACGSVRPGRLVLPATRVPFQIATAWFEPLGHVPVDGLGLPADVVAEDWPDDLAALARAAAEAFEG